MNQLHITGISDAIIRANELGKRIIGICLGMQLLAEESFEIKKTKGLGLIKGSVCYHPSGLQVGWMKIKAERGVNKSIINKEFYFNHSYYLNIKDKNTLYSCQTSTIKYPAIIKKKEVIGIQFHPEKSQRLGLELLGKAIRGEIN